MDYQRDYEQIEKMIADQDSPVGIDAKKTHILILQKLMAIEERLEKLEKQQEKDSEKE